jgi:hypothetical protein
VGTGVWLATLASGVHATIAGVAIGLLATAYPPRREALQHAGAVWRMFREEPTPEYARSASRTLSGAISPNERLQYLFHPWTSFLIVPLFALANAGVELNADAVADAARSPITIGIVIGLVVGKPVGILLATWLAARRGFPLTVPWPQLVGAATVAGIGFTVSLLIADISFEGRELEDAKIGILTASVVASLLAFVVFRFNRRLPPSHLAVDGRVAAPLIDLTEPVDPFVDHVRGPLDAAIVLVEYGDFECPYCGRSEPVVRDLVQSFGDDLMFVFRHLPLREVHEHAQLAAEAAEAAGAQGRFWEMHDAMFAHQDRLTMDDLVAEAHALGLDVEQFSDDLHERRFALRVARDADSAEDSGAAGTPTFFINGRRHRGHLDRDALMSALQAELALSKAARLIV